MLDLVIQQTQYLTLLLIGLRLHRQCRLILHVIGSLLRTCLSIIRILNPTACRRQIHIGFGKITRSRCKLILYRAKVATRTAYGLDGSISGRNSAYYWLCYH